jgi:hypothetical protein
VREARLPGRERLALRQARAARIEPGRDQPAAIGGKEWREDRSVPAETRQDLEHGHVALQAPEQQRLERVAVLVALRLQAPVACQRPSQRASGRRVGLAPGPTGGKARGKREHGVAASEQRHGQQR